MSEKIELLKRLKAKYAEAAAQITEIKEISGELGFDEGVLEWHEKIAKVFRTNSSLIQCVSALSDINLTEE